MSNEIKDFFKTYSDFVTKVTSDPSLDLDALMDRLKEVDASSDIKSARLLTAAMGLGSETGEFVEIVKKMYLQGKPAFRGKYLSYEKRVRRHNVVLGNSMCSS